MKGLDKRIVLARVRNSDIEQLTDWINFTVAQAVQEALQADLKSLREQILELPKVYDLNQDNISRESVIAILESRMK